MEKINFEIIKNHFHESWHKELQPFIDSEKCQNIFTELQKLRSSGKALMPNKLSVIFRAFKETSLDDLKVVFLGLSPYFTPGICDGLAFSCEITKKEQPSLKILLDALENDLGYKDERNPNLKRWANQGVLMLNASLTVLPGDAKCHLDLWKPFTEFLFREIFNKKQLVTIFFGKDAQYFNQFVNKDLHYSISTNHPSYFARNNTPMQTSLFSDTNRVLKNSGKTQINWMEFADLPPWAVEENKKEEYKEFI